MRDNTAYALGFAHGVRKQTYVDKFFEASLEYFEYKQGYVNGVAIANKEMDRHNNDQRTRHQRLDTAQTHRTVHSEA
jgi:hypothetical protein